VSHPKTINSSKMKKTEYQTRRVRSCFNCVIELNQKMLILKRFVTKSVFLCDDDSVEVSHPKAINIKTIS
jgi:hypothetical protein